MALPKAMPLAASLASSSVAALLSSPAYSCPGSAAWIHASAKIAATAQAPCESVHDEILARVHGQPATWHDPHNNGTYSLLSSPPGTLELARRTANDKYTDKLNLVLKPTTPTSCTILGCSESQVTSVSDFGTNYCNMRMLYCSSLDGCHPVTHDFTSTEDAVSTSSPAAQHDMSLCLKV